MEFLRTLFTLAVPIIAQNFLSSFVNMLDTVMVGQLGSVDIAAVSLSNQVFFVMNIMMFGVVSGGSIFISQYWGKKDMEGIHRTVGITIGASAVISVLFFLAATFAPEVCLRIYSSDEMVIQRGAEYLRTVAPCYILFGLSFPFSNAERSTERVKLPMVATIVSVIINGVLNFVLIFGVRINGVQLIPSLGIIGAAIATVCARFVELIIVIIFPYVRHYEIAAGFKQFFSYQSGFISKYIRIAIPVLINETLWGFGASLQNSVFAHAGTLIVAAFNITGTLSNLIWTFFMSCGNAVAIIIGKTIGEGSYDEARSLAKKYVGFLAACAVVMGMLLIPLSKTLPFFFKVEPEVIHMASVFLYITAALYPLYAINMCMIVGVCRSGGDTVFSLIADTGFMWLVALPLGFAAVGLWHLPFWAIFLCIHTEDVCKAAACLVRLFSGKWVRDVTR